MGLFDFIGAAIGMAVATAKEVASAAKEAAKVDPPDIINNDRFGEIVDRGEKNAIIIEKADGSQEYKTGYIDESGHTYVVDTVDGQMVGRKLVDWDNDNKGSAYNYDGGKTTDVTGSARDGKDGFTWETHISIKDEEKPVEKEESVSYTPSQSREEHEHDDPEPYIPPPPPPPRIIHKYVYTFGFDRLNVGKYNFANSSCYITRDIEIGDITDCYLDLYAEYGVDNNSSIEFYIIDNGVTKPIMPLNDRMVSNEKIFSSADTCFKINTAKDFVIRKNGQQISATLAEAKVAEGLHTISYVPENMTDAQRYVPTSNKIKIKIIIRTYGLSDNPPFVKKMKIRKHGGNKQWADTLTT